VVEPAERQVLVPVLVGLRPGPTVVATGEPVDGDGSAVRRDPAGVGVRL
jgi:hypothetical protein